MFLIFLVRTNGAGDPIDGTRDDVIVVAELAVMANIKLDDLVLIDGADVTIGAHICEACVGNSRRRCVGTRVDGFVAADEGKVSEDPSIGILRGSGTEITTDVIATAVAGIGSQEKASKELFAPN